MVATDSANSFATQLTQHDKIPTYLVPDHEAKGQEGDHAGHNASDNATLHITLLTQNDEAHTLIKTMRREAKG